MAAEPYEILVEVTRGPLVESVHFGAFAVADASGRLLASAGDPQHVAYLRSSSKPFQALPLLERGGEQAFNLSDAEIALMCASHSGTDLHYETVSALQARLGYSESDLLCGTDRVRKGIEAQRSLDEILDGFDAELASFLPVREQYLLYE